MRLGTSEWLIHIHNFMQENVSFLRAMNEWNSHKSYRRIKHRSQAKKRKLARRRG